MKRLYLTLLVIISALLFIPNVGAFNTFKADNSLTVKEDFNDNAFFAGNDVNVDSYVNGLGFVAGQTVTVSGEADYGFIAGKTVNISNYKTKDLYAAGETVKIKDVNVRNIYAAGSEVKIESNANDLYVGGETVYVDGYFENANIEANKVEIKGNITGVLNINEDAELTIADGVEVGEIKKYKNPSVTVEKEHVVAGIIGILIARVIAKVLHFINVLVIGFLFIAIYKRANKKIADMNANGGYVFGRFGIGFITLIITPIASIILMLTGIVSALGVITLVLYFLALYLAEVMASIYISRHLLKDMNPYLSYFLVLLVVTLLGIIPVVGWIFSFIILCLGLGVIFTITRQEKVEEVATTTKTTKKGK